MSINEILRQASIIAEESEDDHVQTFEYWINILHDMNNPKVESLIRELYYDLVSMTRYQ